MRYVSSEFWNGLCLVTHEFEAEGDTLPVHQHHWNGINHLTFVKAGRLCLSGTQEERIVEAGHIIQWPLKEPHGFRALTAGAIIVNVRTILDGETAIERRLVRDYGK